jgi:hypothetical protein
VNLVERLRSQFETYGDSRTFTFLHEAGRALVEEVVTFRDLDRGAREMAAWLSTRHDAKQRATGPGCPLGNLRYGARERLSGSAVGLCGSKASTTQRHPRRVWLRHRLDAPRCGVIRSGRV